MKDLAIVVPVYNVENYLDECVSSVLRQSFNDFVLVLVDDGSTDTSGSKCDEWEKTDSRIKVYHKPNGGLMSAWKYGIEHSESRYIGFVDSDDWIDTEMYSRMMDALTRYDADIVSCGFEKFFEDDRTQSVNSLVEDGYFDREHIESSIFPMLISGGDYKQRGLLPNRVTKLFKRELLEGCLPYCMDDVSIGEDLLTTFCVIQKANGFVNLKDFYPYHYRIYGNSMITAYDDKKYKKISILRKRMLAVNKSSSYDFSIQINTDYIKLMLMELDNEILKSGNNRNELIVDMRKMYRSRSFQDALANSEVKKLPIKYRLYIFFLKYHFYDMALLMRKMKK